MPKLKKNTTKVGQKCVLTIKTNLYHNYKDKTRFDKNGYKTDSGYFEDLNSVLRYMTVIDLKNLKNYSKLTLNLIKTIEKNTEVQVIEYPVESRLTKLDGLYKAVELEIISGDDKGFRFFSDLTKIQGRLDTAHFPDLASNLNTKPSFKIFYNGSPLKAKIFNDMTKIKASLMSAMNYNGKLSKLNKHFKELSPEVSESGPEWKESQIIKDAIKISKLKGIKKCSKYGKTSIVFRSEGETQVVRKVGDDVKSARPLMKLIRNLEKGSYFVLNMRGEELKEENERITLNRSRLQKLNQILSNEFSQDVS